MRNPRWTILCDFDGTISLGDVTDRLLAAFGRPGWESIESDWRGGRIGSQECLARQIALLDADSVAIDSIIDGVSIDPDFPEFLKLARMARIEVIVVSDGLDRAIRRILDRYQLGYLQVRANQFTQISARGWSIQFPYAQVYCVSGNCKCAATKPMHLHGNSTLMIGDGQSDACVAAVADFVFAKDQLQEYCARNDIAHRQITGFAQACELLPQLLSGEFEPLTSEDFSTPPRVQYA